MTKNQRSVLRWLQERCSASGIIRCSQAEIALEFCWSQPYALKILRSMVEDELLQELHKGKGHGASKYRIVDHPKSSSHNQNGSLAITKKRKGSPQQVPSDNSKKTFAFSDSKRLTDNIEEGMTRQRMRVASMQKMLDSADRVKKPVKTTNSPFRRFRQHWDDVSKWGTTDFVCYYSYLYKVRFGEEPALEWPMECGAARVLLGRLKLPEAFKGFLQIAFSRCKFKPNGLRSFSFGSFYEEVVNSEVTQDILDDWDDEWVLPWLKEEMVARSRIENQKYNDNFIRVAFSPRNQRRRDREHKQRTDRHLDRVIRENWSLYSEIGR